jgi:hypothetical protein
MGWRSREPRKPVATVERLGRDCLDVNDLKRCGLLQDDPRVLRPGFARWPAIIRIVSERYWLDLYLSGRQTPQQVRVSWTRCHLGGFRPWMHCPHCQKRVGKLLPGIAGYSCRACIGNPLYASQAKSRPGRIHFELCKLRLLLGGEATVTQPFPDRPRGMHRKTYEQICERATRLEMDLPRRHRAKTPDYPNLVYYAS